MLNTIPGGLVFWGTSHGNRSGSCTSRVKTETIYLGTADRIRDWCRVDIPPLAVHAKAFEWMAAFVGQCGHGA